MRMNVDVAFKREMLKRLAKKLKGIFTKKNFKNLLDSIISELERPSERYFNIFDSGNFKKIQIPSKAIDEYLNQILSGIPTEKLRGEFVSKRSSLIFLKKLMENTEKGTTLYRAVEDLVEEYETGVFFPRYFKKGEISNYISYNFNYYSILLLEHRLGNLEKGFKLSLTLLNLIPEYYYNEIIITNLLFETLNELFEFKIPLSKAKASVLAIHFISVLCEILFENLPYKDKLELLQTNYEFTLNPEDIELIADQIDDFITLSPGSSSLKEEKEIQIVKNLNLNRSNAYLLNQAGILFHLNLHPFSILIYKYLKENIAEEFTKTLMSDNIATGLRELGKYEEAIKIYETLKKYYKKNNMLYRLFLIKKNIGYCYYQLGNKQKMEEILNKLEADVSIYSKYEKVRVYYNLAVRYRATYQFENEEKYLNLALEITEFNHPLYFEIQNRSLELESYFDLYKGKLDNNALKILESDLVRKKNMGYAYTFLNNNQLSLCRYYLDRAYNNIQKDNDYWKTRSVINIQREEWENLKKTSEKVINFDSNDLLGNLYQCLYFIHVKDFPNILNILLKLQSEIRVIQKSNPLAFASIYRAFHFIIRSFSNEEIKKLIDFMFEYNRQSGSKSIKLTLIIGEIFVKNREKVLSGYIYKKFLKLQNSEEGCTLYAGWCFHFNDFKNAEHFYKRALAISPNNINLLERLTRVEFMLNNFEKSLKYLNNILKISKGKTNDVFTDLKNYIILVRNSKLRFENIPFKDVKTIFNTVEYNLKILDPNKDIEFGTMLTGLSKGLETLLAHTLGHSIYEYVKEKHFPLPKKYEKGLHISFRNFFNDPDNYNPTLGNWSYILKGIINGIDPQNPLMKDIYDFLRKSPYFEETKLRIIVKIKELFVKERNLGTHKRIYSKNEVEHILRQNIPLFNEVIGFLQKRWEKSLK